MAVWNRFQSLIFGGAIGAAARTAIEPQIEPARQLAWSLNTNRILEPGTLARLVAQGITSEGAAAPEANRSGYDDNRLASLIQLALTVPDTGALDEMLNRETITPAQFKHALAKLQIEPTYWDALLERTNDKLSPADIANAIQQSFLPDPGFIPGAPSGGTPYDITAETVNIPPLEELKASGLDRDQLHVLTQLSGNPPGPHELLDMWNRRIITEASVEAGIREGRTKTKWIPALKELRHQIPSALDGIQGHLRGWLTVPEMYAATARHGMSPADTDLLFKIHGRPPSWHQIWIGLQRGGTYDGPIDQIDPAFLKGLRESDLRPEWYNLLWHSRYSYPSPFVLRQLTTSHAITEADAEQVLKFEGYEPTFAAKIATAWAGGAAGAAKADPHVTKAQNSLYAALHSSYVKRESGAGDVTPGMTALGIPGPAQTEILSLWDVERALIHAELSPAQIKKAIRTVTINPSTGVAWSHADGIAALLARGYSQADAETFLNE